MAQYVLVDSSDPTLGAEIEDSISRLGEDRPVVILAPDLPRAIESLRSRRPQFAIVNMDRGLLAFKAFAQEIQSAAPDTVIIGAYLPDERDGGLDARVRSAALIEAVRCGAKDFLRRPAAAPDLAEILKRFQTDGSRRHDGRIAPAVAFVSNKGGVGKSTLAVNAACRLAQRHPDGVLLIDASLQMGVCHSMLDVRPSTTLLDAARERDRLDGTLLRQLAVPHESGVDLLAAPPDAIAAAEVDEELLCRILSLARREYQYVVIDTFPVFDRAIMAILDVSDLAFVVLDNVVPTTLGVAKLLELMDGLDYPVERRRVVVNRYMNSASSPSLEDVADRLKAEIDFVLPYDKRAIAAANVGRPFAMSRLRWSKLESGLSSIVDEIERQAAKLRYADEDAGGESLPAGSSLR